MHPDDGRVVSNFIVQALREQPLTIYGDGSQTRSFCYVDDLVEGLIRLMASEASFTGPVNLGNPGEFSMLALADAVMRATGSVSTTVFKPLPQDDPLQRKPDISLARKALDWKPKIELQEGLSRTVEYFRDVVSN
jgi:UDP-glucuronate decarboxylase